MRVRFPYAMAWVGEDRVALIATDAGSPAAQALVYELDIPRLGNAAARPTGDIFRLLQPWHGGFTNSPAEAPSYPTAGATADQPGGVRPLRALSRATYARSGRVTVGPFDSGQFGCVWDRLYVEASIPDHAGLRIWAHADDWGGHPVAPGMTDAPDWALHIVGPAAAIAEIPEAPLASWCDEASERPFDKGLLPCLRAANRTGLFTAAIQHAGRRVRRIEGRYLWLNVELVGDSQVSPEVAAIRAYASRFSYRDRYLPALYHEALAGPDADAAGPATASDFLERLLTLFEGPLTQLEEKVAGGWLLTDPGATPVPALPWLGAWIGLHPDAAEAPERFRQALKAAPWTARLHGTLGGLMADLELATGGLVLDGGRIDPYREVPRPGELALATLNGVVTRALMLAINGSEASVLAGGALTRGEIVVVEGFRLRRTFATILGADLADEDDPLTLGLAEAPNRFVGDTLFLGDEARREFMALFSADLPQSQTDRRAVAEFFERLAHRVMVLVRRGPNTRDLARLHEVAVRAAPAHVEVSVTIASRPLIVGVASLVGLDTYLAETPPRSRVRIGASRVGAGDQVHGEGRLDARAAGPVSARPVAVAEGPSEVWSGTGFVISAARSHAAAGRRVARNIWMWERSPNG
jgi:phage tail-like protein